MDIEVMRLHARDEFQTWLARDFEVREELYAMAGGDFGIDTASLDRLEAFLLRRYATPEEALALNERAVLDAAARHVGLIMLLNVDGAVWAIDLDDADNAFYRLPIIRLADGGEECPLTMVTAALDRRFGDYLREMVERYQSEYNAAPDA